MIKPITNRPGQCLTVSMILFLFDCHTGTMAWADEVSEDLTNIVALVEDDIMLSMQKDTDVREASVEEAALAKKEIHCLALNIYFEARGESEQGQLAVGHVVMNRVASTQYPDAVCSVVRQGGEKRLHRCQFSWWCDGRSDKPTNGKAWTRSLRLAIAVYTGKSPDPTNGALWYHAAYVTPYWRDALTLVRKIGRHHFYLKKPPQMFSMN
jgi:spore germination cell wall hydrolase CwlJ-like protein